MRSLNVFNLMLYVDILNMYGTIWSFRFRSTTSLKTRPKKRYCNKIFVKGVHFFFKMELYQTHCPHKRKFCQYQRRIYYINAVILLDLLKVLH